MRSGRHYMSWAIVCFAATLLVNLNQQIFIVSAHVGGGLLKQKEPKDVERDNEYLRNHLSLRISKRWCPQIHEQQQKLKQQEQQQQQREERQQQRSRQLQRDEEAIEMLALPGVESRQLRLVWAKMVAVAQVVKFIAWMQFIAMMQVVAFILLNLGIALFGATMIKIGLVLEGAFLIGFAAFAVEECAPAIFVHFIRLPEEEEDAPMDEMGHAEAEAQTDVAAE